MKISADIVRNPTNRTRLKLKLEPPNHTPAVGKRQRPSTTRARTTTTRQENRAIETIERQRTSTSTAHTCEQITRQLDQALTVLRATGRLDEIEWLAEIYSYISRAKQLVALREKETTPRPLQGPPQEGWKEWERARFERGDYDLL